MPREIQKRGRREQARKRKLQEVSTSDDAADYTQSKRPREEDEEETYHNGLHQDAERPFYGLLDEQEQEYFRRADELLEHEHPPGSSEEALLLANVFREVSGKELKLACSQSASRFFEKLLARASLVQLAAVWDAFKGHFLHLVQHRFASHCCEELFLHSTRRASDGGDTGAFEATFLDAVGELKGNFGYLITDRFASHTVRVILRILSGHDVTSIRETKESVKSDHGVVTIKVSKHFTSALKQVMAEALAGLEPHSLRALAAHPSGGPTLQLMAQLEAHHLGTTKHLENDSQMMHLIPHSNLTPDSEETQYLLATIRHPVGSRLLEALLPLLPGKGFKIVWRHFFIPHLKDFAQDDVASYVLSRALQRLSPVDLQAASKELLPLLPPLARRGRTVLIRGLIERSAARKLDLEPIRGAILSCWSEKDKRSLSLPDMLELGDQDDTDGPEERKSIVLHRSLLAQTMVDTPGVLSELLFDALTSMPAPTCRRIAAAPALSPIVQKSLTANHASSIFRRKLITRFYSNLADLAMDPAGSRVVDAIWDGTIGMAFARERVAEELAENELKLRANNYGRKVWRNWMMDMYKRRRAEWIGLVRDQAGNNLFQSFPDGVVNERTEDENDAPIISKANLAKRKQTQGQHPPARTPTALDLARERHARRVKEAAMNK